MLNAVVSVYVFWIYRPAGWDNEKKMAILQENMTSTIKPEDFFNDVIQKPMNSRKVSRVAM